MSMSIDIILLKIEDVLYNVLYLQWKHRLEYSCMEIVYVKIKNISCMSMSIDAIFFRESIDVNIKAEGDFSSFLDVIYGGLIFSKDLLRLLGDLHLLWRHSPPNNCNGLVKKFCIYSYIMVFS